MAALSSPVAGEGVRRGRAPVPTPVGGTGKGRERPSEVGQAGWAWGLAQLGQGPVGGGFSSSLFLFVSPLLHFLFFLFIFFSVLIHLKAFRHFIKM